MASALVADMGYQAFEANRRVKVTGASNALTASLVKFLPRSMILGLVRSLQSPA